MNKPIGSMIKGARMTRETIAFSVISLIPLPLLVAGAVMGGVWPWIALIYLTVFAFLMDEVIAVNFDDGREFPAANILSVLLAIAHFALLAFVIHTFAKGMGLIDGVALFLATGLFLGQVSNSNAHELIHKGDRFLHSLGKWVYISLLFGHHASAHRYVHHRDVASNKDPNSARMGESYYRFAIRAWIGSFRCGLAEERARFEGRSALSNPYALYICGALAFVLFAIWLGGPVGCATYVGLAFYAQSQLLISDYVQHYGLRRRELETGKLEPVNVLHSWNAPHVFSSRLMLNAPRHSDHHTHPSRGFAKLTLPTNAPSLPYSLPAMSVIALFPPVWRRVMDQRVTRVMNREGTS